MSKRDELLHRVTEANPVPNDAELPNDVVDTRPPLGLLISKEDAPSPDVRPPQTAHAKRRWRGPLVAAGTAVAILVIVGASLVLLRNGQGEVADQPIDPTPTTSAPTPTTVAPPPTTVEPVPTTAPPPPTTVVVSPESWDPILATTTAGVAPPAADCPAGSNPEVPGPVEQVRPEPRRVGNLAGAFDQHTGRVVYVDINGETWLFDVCTNTWHQPKPDGTPIPGYELYDARGQPAGWLGPLVYDVDSDVTVMIGFRRVSVYDANTNTWDQRAIEIEDVGPLGAVYDPVSGLVITSTNSTSDGDRWDLWAYDVDTNVWTPLGPVSIDRDTPCCTGIDLLGYSDALDRLILTTYVGSPTATFLVDPRSGEMVISPTADVPIVNLVWPGHAYGTGDGSVQVYMQENRSVCWFDAATLRWPCVGAPPDTAEQYFWFGAIVGDPINNRLLFIHGVHGGGKGATDDIWALDLDTGEWNQVLALSQQ